MAMVIGIDAAFANMGLCRGSINLRTMSIEVSELLLLSTQKMDKKLVRKSSDDLRRAQELHRAMNAFCQGASVAFAEVPSGSLSASAARALGIAVGVLGGCCIPIIEVSQQEVKLASVGTKTATKEQMIAWAVSKHPAANWLRKKTKGADSLTAANEHLADACATIWAGRNTPAFKQAFALQEAMANQTQERKRIVWKP